MAELPDTELTAVDWLNIKSTLHEVALVHLFASFHALLRDDQKEIFLTGFEQQSHRCLYLGLNPDENSREGQARMNEFSAKNREQTAAFLAMVRGRSSPPKSPGE